VVHTLAAGGTPLPDILVRTSEVMVRDDLGYATVLIAVVDPRAGTLSYVTAGHLPPLVRRPGGSVDILTGGRHSVLGIELTPRPPGFLPFPAGSTLVIYTDGLIERRDTAIDVSVATLADTLRAPAAPTAEEPAAALLDHRGPDDRASGDVPLGVARPPPRPAPARRPRAPRRRDAGPLRRRAERAARHRHRRVGGDAGRHAASHRGDDGRGAGRRAPRPPRAQRRRLRRRRPGRRPPPPLTGSAAVAGRPRARPAQPSSRRRTASSAPRSSMAAALRRHMARNIASPRSVTPAVSRPSSTMSGACSSPSR